MKVSQNKLDHIGVRNKQLALRGPTVYSAAFRDAALDQTTDLRLNDIRGTSDIVHDISVL